MREQVESIVRAALDASYPEPMVRRFLSSFDLFPYDRIFVLGAGKAAGTMARGIERGQYAIADGLVVVKDGYMVERLSQVRQVEAAHPIPDRRGAEAARGLLQLAARACKNDLVICLISGGGSALTTLPAGDLSLEDLRQTVEALLRSGAGITEVNAVRKHLTIAGAGRLAEAAYPAKVVTLIISDVTGDALDVIASGPTVGDASSFSDTIEVIERYGLTGRLPPAVIAHLKAGVRGDVEETPKPGAKIFERVENHILASNRAALEAAAAAGKDLGFTVLSLNEPQTGESREAAEEIVALALRQSDGQLPFCLLAGGETTVTVTGSGAGGRAQEFALAAAVAMDGRENTLAFAFGTDGTDGFTDAAGAVSDGTTLSRARDLGIDVLLHLRDNDSYPVFEALDDLIITGPTGTNVNDIYGVLISS